MKSRKLLLFALALPLPHECDKALEILAVGFRWQRREFQRLRSIRREVRWRVLFRALWRRPVNQAARVPADESFRASSLLRRCIDCFVVHALQLFPNGPPMIFLGAFGEPHQIAGLEPPIGRGQHARAGHIVRRAADRAANRPADPGPACSRGSKICGSRTGFAFVAARRAVGCDACACDRARRNCARARRPHAAARFPKRPNRLPPRGCRIRRRGSFLLRGFRFAADSSGSKRRLLVIADHRVRPRSGCAWSSGNSATARRETCSCARLGTWLLASAEPLKKHREASVGGAAKPVNRLIMVAHGHDVAMPARQQPQQFELRDVGVLKLVDQNVAVLIAHCLSRRASSLRRSSTACRICAPNVLRFLSRSSRSLTR